MSKVINMSEVINVVAAIFFIIIIVPLYIITLFIY